MHLTLTAEEETLILNHREKANKEKYMQAGMYSAAEYLDSLGGSPNHLIANMIRKFADNPQAYWRKRI